MTVLYAYDSIEQSHSRDGHPENRGRLSNTLKLLERDGILERVTPVEVSPISTDRLALVHPPDYIAGVEAVARQGGGNLDPDTYVGPRSYDAARASAGALTAVVEGILKGDATHGMSLMRPPGHHALSDQAMGFCIFANVAVAARVAQVEHGLERVLIVDWDVHHGNGTEAIFWRDSGVAFFSSHQHPFYPGTGAAIDVGEGKGSGTTLNLPLPPGIGDQGYRRGYEELLVPFAESFRPELIIVSAGFDAHWRDPLASESLTLTGFAHLHRLVGHLRAAIVGRADDLPAADASAG